MMRQGTRTERAALNMLACHLAILASIDKAVQEWHTWAKADGLIGTQAPEHLSRMHSLRGTLRV